eukprot:scaffold4623_cov49-Phaeocystis_antarctica.AAC.3
MPHRVVCGRLAQSAARLRGGVTCEVHPWHALEDQHGASALGDQLVQQHDRRVGLRHLRLSR